MNDQILSEFSTRLAGMNAQHQRMQLPAIDSPAITPAQRVQHLRALLDGIEADAARGRVDERHLVQIGVHALAWLRMVRQGRRPLTVVPGDGGPQSEFLPADGPGAAA